MPRPKKATQKSEADITTPAEVETGSVKKAPSGKYKQAGSGTSFDIFSDDSKEMELELMAKSGLTGGLKSAADIAREFLPYPHMALEWVMGHRGIPIKTISELIGQENTGKSSLMFRMMSTFVQHNIPCYYINTEPKCLETDWIARLTGVHDPKLAKKVAKAITVAESVFTLDDMDEHVRNWAHIMRYGMGDRCVPMDVPLVIVIDSLSKLLNSAEASILGGADSKGSGKKVAMMKGVADISQQPGITAKWQHAWTRVIAPFLDSYNVTIIAISGQNTKMDAAGGAKFAADGGASLNKTKTGGQGVNQSAGFQATLTTRGMAKDTSGNTIGRLVRLRTVKGSYGPAWRDIVYTIQFDRFSDDSSNYISDAINMDEALANVLVETKVFGFSVDRKRYTSQELGILQMTAKELCEKIHSDDDLRYTIGSALRIGGYESINPEFA